METRNPSTSESGMWTWIVLAALLVLSGLVAVGSLALLNANLEAQTATTTTTPQGTTAPQAPPAH